MTFIRWVTFFATLVYSGASSVSQGEVYKIVVATGNGKKPPYEVGSDLRSKFTFGQAVFGSLVNVSKSYIIENRLLESWRWDLAKGGYYLRVRSGLRFHNGRLATSKDLEFSILRWVFTSQKSFEKSNLSTIEGVDEILPGSPYISGSVRGVKVIDDKTLFIKLKRSHPSFMFALNSPSFSLVPIEELKRDYITWKKFPVGAGPYRVVDVKSDGRTRLEKIDLASGGPKIFEISSNATDVDVDIYTGGYEQEKSSSYRLITIKDEYDLVLSAVFNFSSEAAKNKHFRRAVFYGIDRARIHAETGRGMPVTQLISPMFAGYRALDRSQFREIALQEVKKMPSKLRSKTYEMPVFGLVAQDKTVRIICESLKEIGLNFQPTYSSDKNGNSLTSEQPVRLTWFGLGSVVDPAYIFSLFTKAGPMPHAYPQDNETYERLFEEASEAANLEVLAQKIHKMSEYIEESALVVPIIATEPDFRVKSTLAIKGIEQQRSAILFDVTKLAPIGK